MPDYKLKVPDISVFTNLETRLKSRTTKEEANKEVERMIESRKLFDGYEWKIEGCEKGGINHFDEKLVDDIIERIEQFEPEDCIDWDGGTAHYDLDVAHVQVKTNLEVRLKSGTKAEAVTEVSQMCAEKNLFEGYEWRVADCDEAGINEFSDALRDEIVDAIGNAGDAGTFIEEVG